MTSIIGTQSVVGYLTKKFTRTQFVSVRRESSQKLFTSGVEANESTLVFVADGGKIEEDCMTGGNLADGIEMTIVVQHG